jgi:YbbR domain-containing protein
VASYFRRLTENWKLKTLAVALAVLLWIVVSAEQITTNWIWVPLEVQVADPSYQLAAAEVRDVQVRFTGAGRDLLDLAVRRPPLRLRIDAVDDEQGVYRLEPRMVQLPGQIAVNPLDVRPSTVRLEFTRVDSRVVPVRVRTTELAGTGWTVVDTLRAEPDRVRISGPAAAIRGVTEVYTLPVELAPSEPVVERTVELDVARLQGVDLATRRVTVTGRLDRLAERTVPNVRVDVGGGVGVVPGLVSVQLRGPQSVVQGLTPAQFRVVVAIDEIPVQIPPEGLPVPLRVDRLPPGVQGEPLPAQARLIPTRSVADTVSLPGVPILPDTVAEPDSSD